MLAVFILHLLRLLKTNKIYVIIDLNINNTYIFMEANREEEIFIFITPDYNAYSGNFTLWRGVCLCILPDRRCYKYILLF